MCAEEKNPSDFWSKIIWPAPLIYSEQYSREKTRFIIILRKRDPYNNFILIIRYTFPFRCFTLFEYESVNERLFVTLLISESFFLLNKKSNIIIIWLFVSTEIIFIFFVVRELHRPVTFQLIGYGNSYWSYACIYFFIFFHPYSLINFPHLFRRY